MAKLLVIRGARKGFEFPLEEAAVLGREQADFPLQDTKASRRHTKVYRMGAQYYVEDLGSRNGTLLNGEKVEGSSPLASGDTIQIGLTHLRFVDAGEDRTVSAPQTAARPKQSPAPEPRANAAARAPGEKQAEETPLRNEPAAAAASATKEKAETPGASAGLAKPRFEVYEPDELAAYTTAGPGLFQEDLSQRELSFKAVVWGVVVLFVVVVFFLARWLTLLMLPSPG